jgi:hypothetical protein
MSKIDRVHKEIAESEYNSYEVGKPVTISQDYLIGTTLNFNDNRSGNGEQVYAIASDGSNVFTNVPSNERVKVKEIIL